MDRGKHTSLNPGKVSYGPINILRRLFLFAVKIKEEYPGAIHNKLVNLCKTR